MQLSQPVTIYIGKEPGQGRLMLYTVYNGLPRTATLGQPGMVPQTVSRCKPGEQVAHCSITVSEQGTMIIKNLKEQNVTCVNGMPIVSKRVKASDSVTLGKDAYPINMAEIVMAIERMLTAQAPQPQPQPRPMGAYQPQQPSYPMGGYPQPQPRPQTPQPQTYSVSHLEEVWDEYHDSLQELRAKGKRINMVRTGCGMFSMITVPAAMVLGPWAYAFTGIGVIGTLYGFLAMKNDDTPEMQESLNEYLQDNYICPNPQCGHFLGNMPYRLLRRQIPKCPRCGSKFVD